MKRIIIGVIVLGALHIAAYTQELCGTSSTGKDQLQVIPYSQQSDPASYYTINVFFHIMRRSNGTGGQSNQTVDQALSILRGDFFLRGICVYELGRDEIWDDTYYNINDIFYFGWDGDGDGKFDNFSPNAVSNAVDIYLFDEDANFNGGIAAGIPATALVLGGTILNVNLANSHVVSHELGHCLGLWHTFHACETGDWDFVDNTNWQTTGDFVYDTPPDRNSNIYQVNSECIWDQTSCNSSLVDGHGDPINPDMTLIMAYIPPGCMSSLTPYQGYRMRWHLANIAIMQNIIVPDNITYSNLDILAGVTNYYDAVYNLTAQTNVLVEPNGSLTFKAGESITLKPLFHAKSSSFFHAYIEPACLVARAKPVIQEENGKRNSFIKMNTFAIKLYPNPADNILKMEVITEQKASLQIQILSISGATLKTAQYAMPSKGVYNHQLNITDLIPGLYFVCVSDGVKTIVTKVVKK